DEPSAMRRNLGFHQTGEDRLNPSQRAFFVFAHQPRVAGDVGGKDRGEAADRLQRFGVAHSRTRVPARAGQAAARPDRPRSIAPVRTKELTVACKARKRSSTAANK